MEAAKIDWESLESVFVMDRVYEEINAPQWVDFLAPPSPLHSHDDVAWFCRPDCEHPTSAQDFLVSASPSSKLFKSIARIADWTRSDANLKRRAPAPSSMPSENQNPNVFLTPNHQTNYLAKATIKSSSQKARNHEDDDEYTEILLRSHHTNKPRLKPSQSARDLFGVAVGGKDILAKITDFCNELKNMATRAKEREDLHATRPSTPIIANQQQKPSGGVKQEGTRNILGPLSTKMNDRDRERKPLLQATNEGIDAAHRSVAKDKPRKNKIRRPDDDAENIPVSVDLNTVKRKADDKLLLIRTNPPTPQGFSATRDPSKTTPSKAPKSRLMDREILQGSGQNKTLREELGEKSHSKSPSLDVFWFLKPCTLSS